MKLYIDKKSTWTVAAENKEKALQHFVDRQNTLTWNLTEFASTLEDIEEVYPCPFNPKKRIADQYEYVEYCCDLLDNWLSDIDKYPGYTRPVDEENDYYDDDNNPPKFMYTDRGSALVERAISRLYRLGEKHYGDLEDEINSNYFIEY